MAVENDDLFPVIVIGGGLAGLVAAVHLTDRGIPAIVLEADRLWPGGRLSGGESDTFDFGGCCWSFKPEHSVHALWGGYENLRAVIERFTTTKLIPSSGEEWINRWGREVRTIEAGNAVRSRWLPAPFHYLQLLFHPRIWSTITPLDFISLPGFLFSILSTVGFDPIKEGIALDGLMMKEYFRGWTPNLRATFRGLGVNLLAAPEETISLTAFIAALRFYTVMRRDSWAMHYFPANSHDALIQPLIDQIHSKDGQLMSGITAQRLDRIDNGWRVIVEDSVRGGLRSLYTQQIIMAVNAPAAKRLLESGADTAEIAARLKFPAALSNAVVRLWFSKSPREGTLGGMFTGDFVPDNFFWLHRMYDDFAEWHEITGGSAVEVHIYGSELLLDQPDPNLLILAVDEVQRAFPDVRGSFVHGLVRRNSRTHTQFRVPTVESLHVQTPWPGIFACGDWIGYPTPSLWMERATVTGIAAANRVLDANGVDQFPIISPRRPELLVIVLGALVRALRVALRPLIIMLRALRRRSHRVQN